MLKIKKKTVKAIELEGELKTELEHEQLVKGVNKMQTGKKIYY